MVTCHCRPRADHRAIAKLEIEGGQQVTVDTGMNEVEFAERLENLIVRFENKLAGPDEAELEVVSRHRQCKSHNEQMNFLDSLPQDPKFGLKARALAVKCLYSRKVTDFATLSVVNRITAGNAYALARSLLDMPGTATPDELRANPLLVQLKSAPPEDVPDGELAYIPATSNDQYNRYVRDFMMSNPQEMFPAHRDLAITVQNEVRDRLGAVAMPENTQLISLIGNERLAGIYPSGWGEERRNNVETIRESFLAAALQCGALRILDAEMGRAISALGGDPARSRQAVNGLIDREALFFRDLAAAETPEQAREIVAGVRDRIQQMARLYCKAEPLQRNLAERTRQHLAQKMGVSREDIGDEQNGVPFRVGQDSQELLSKILSGEIPANTDEEIEAVFDNLMEEYVAELTDRIDALDRLDPPLAPHVADQVKAMLFSAQKLTSIDIGRIAGNVRDRVSTEQLDNLLRNNADKVQVQNSLAAIKANIGEVMREILAGQQDLGPDDWDGILKMATIIAIRSRPGLADRLDAFFLRPDVRREIAENDDDKQTAVVMDLFRDQSFHPDVFAGGPWQAAKMRRLFSAPREMAEFKAAGGEVAALQAGYHAKDMPMLARAFVLVKAAKVVDDETALKDVLKPDSQSRLLFSYGGRFIETPENFRRGLLLMAKFRDWRAAQYDAYVAGRRDTPTLLNAKQDILASRVGLERFVLEEIGSNPAFDLDEENGEKLFGVANNKAMRLIGLGYGSSSYGTMMGLAAEKRAFICDVLDIFNCPLPQTQADKEAWTELKFPSIFLARVLKHWDELEELREEGHLDRAHVMPILYGDLGLPQGATNADINQGFDDRLMPLDFGVSMNIQFMMNASGDTFDACREAHEHGHWLPNAPGIVGFSPDLDGVNGTADARATMTGDLNRAANPGLLPDRIPILQAADVRYLFHFPGNQTLASKFGLENDPEVAAASNAIADKLERLCGKVHEKQLAAVYYALSQSAASALKGAFIARGVASDEHMALTHTISRDNATGTVTIVTSQPEGLKDRDNRPLNFHWTTTVALDGTVTTTPMVIEQPQ